MRTVVDQAFDCGALARHFGRQYEVGGSDLRALARTILAIRMICTGTTATAQPTTRIIRSACRLMRALATGIIRLSSGCVRKIEDNILCVTCDEFVPYSTRMVVRHLPIHRR